MNFDELNLTAQLIESMRIATAKLERAMEKNNLDEIKTTKAEILKFQSQISKILTRSEK